MRTNSLSIVIPAYNEEENIEWVLNNALQSLPKYFSDYEVLLIDDGSKDKTGEIADRLASQNGHIRVIHQPNGGYSRAMRTGIMAAQKNFIAYLPADGQFLVEDMRHCFEKLDGHDLLLGYRGSRPDYSFSRIILSYGYLLLLLVLFGIRWIDVGWVFIWRAEKVQKLKLNAVGGIFILTETVVRFQKAGYKVAEAPSYYRPRRFGEVKNAALKVVWDTFMSAVKLWWKLKFGRRSK